MRGEGGLGKRRGGGIGGGEGAADWGVVRIFFRSRFSPLLHPHRKKATQTSRIAAFVRRARMCVVPIVMDRFRGAASDQKNDHIQRL
jgi:hypothetical protein